MWREENFRASVVPYPRAKVPNAVLGMALLVAVEAMFFAGLISAFIIVKSSFPLWPPPGQVRLPVLATAINSVALLLSGVTLWLAGRAFDRGETRRFIDLWRLSIGLGTWFVLFQGTEWVHLINEGLTVRSGPRGSFFYLIVGAHALHAVAALLVLGLTASHHVRRTTGAGRILAAQIFWYFVVGIWPLIYVLVYQ